MAQFENVKQKVVLKVINMIDDKMKQKAIEAAADVHGVDSIAAELENQELMVVGEMDAVAVVKKLKKVAGTVDIVSVGPAVAPEEPPPSPPPPADKKRRRRKRRNKILKMK
ncbi:hypothetical protein L1987_11791 [Smallanthus sonchifolius]|uniref:Uncharacterized protein n=1 Tax=Smallanthus sonchifolius TaxID=185202 RepID=A0ACB9JBZ9_9ASTR|nr:hypothetical protein L1987_11791 [Smallanthus sonchifolius]